MTREVLDSAAAVARVRAEEADLPPEERLFEDPYARLFDGGEGGARVLERYSQAPFFREQVRLRTRFIDDFVRRGIADGVRQIVVLGAGFDCRALRIGEIAASRCRVFEIDFASQLESKRRTLESAGVRLPEHLHPLAADFAAPDWEARLTPSLAGSGFVPSSPALLLCEGVVSYLAGPEIDRALRWMATVGGGGSRAIVSYVVALLAPGALAARSSRAGFRRIEDLSFGEVFRRHLPGEPPPGGDLFRVAVLTT